jgi:polysaccharide export outer membrane protein
MKTFFTKNLYPFIAITCIVVLNSCVSTKNLIYFQENATAKKSDTLVTYLPIYCINDKLSIKVSGADENAVKPFNKVTSNPPAGGILDAGTEISESSGGEYLVDEKGLINFPVIGQLKVSGLNRTELTNLLIEKLKVYIKDPVVDIHITNFKIIFLGEINGPGSYPVSNERISIIEAISIAGDLKIHAIRDDILVIRELDGKRIEYSVNINSKDIFNSPVYYLRQNDIIYVKPTKGAVIAANRERLTFVRTNISVITSIASVVLTFAVLLNLKK